MTSGTISNSTLREYQKLFLESAANIAAMNSVTANGISTCAKDWRISTTDSDAYSLQLPCPNITNQKNSGRCWMFAALNCMRAKIIENIGDSSFELSQNFTLFYDKLEKANYFLQTIIELSQEPTNSRLMEHLLKAPVQDGGQWDMISALVQKYGVVPKSVMPETVCSSSTREMNSLLTEKLRDDACLIRKMQKNGASYQSIIEKKATMISEIYKILCICLGTPPEKFDFKVRAKDGTYICDKQLTPLEFYEKYVGLPLQDYISLIHAPTEDKPFMRSYTVKYLGNIIGASPVKYINLPINELKRAAIAQMKNGEPVWFGCDVGKYSDRQSGIMDLNIFDYSSLFNTSFQMSKSERLEYGHSRMTHAMVFQGVDLEESGTPAFWLVENSWGDDKGHKGMFRMSDSWFDEYMYQVVVNRKYLEQEILDAFDASPIELPPWDPMGSLAE